MVSGPPFKFKMTKTEHTRFVQSVRYSPNGDHFATGGFDGKVFIYDGKSSELVGELGEVLITLKFGQFLFDFEKLNFYFLFIKHFFFNFQQFQFSTVSIFNNFNFQQF